MVTMVTMVTMVGVRGMEFVFIYFFTAAAGINKTGVLLT